MILQLFFSFLLAQDKVLVEEGKPVVDAGASVIAEKIELKEEPLKVVIQDTDSIPDYFLQNHIGRKFSDILAERDKLVCDTIKDSLLSCFHCSQDNNRFTFAFEFGKKPNDNTCVLVRYGVRLKEEAKSEEVAVEFLKKMGLEIDLASLATPMIFEKPPLQINLRKTSDNKLAIDFLNPEMQAQRATYDSKYVFLQEEVQSVWDQYTTITSQYLEEVGVKENNFLKDEKLIKPKPKNDTAFISHYQSLVTALEKQDNKEEKACLLYAHKDLLDYPVSDELKTKLKADKVQSSWWDQHRSLMKDSVCGNYMFLEDLKEHFLLTKHCSQKDLDAQGEALEDFLKKKISILEKQLALIYLTSLNIKNIYTHATALGDSEKEKIFKNLDLLSSLGDGYVSYAKFKKDHWKEFRPENAIFVCY